MMAEPHQIEPCECSHSCPFHLGGKCLLCDCEEYRAGAEDFGEPWVTRYGESGMYIRDRHDVPLMKSHSHSDDAQVNRALACINALAGHDPESVKQLITTYGELVAKAKALCLATRQVWVDTDENFEETTACMLALRAMETLIAEIDAPEDASQ